MGDSTVDNPVTDPQPQRVVRTYGRKSRAVSPSADASTTPPTFPPTSHTYDLPTANSANPDVDAMELDTNISSDGDDSDEQAIDTSRKSKAKKKRAVVASSSDSDDAETEPVDGSLVTKSDSEDEQQQEDMEVDEVTATASPLFKPRGRVAKMRARVAESGLTKGSTSSAASSSAPGKRTVQTDESPSTISPVSEAIARPAQSLWQHASAKTKPNAGATSSEVEEIDQTDSAKNNDDRLEQKPAACPKPSPAKAQRPTPPDVFESDDEDIRPPPTTSTTSANPPTSTSSSPHDNDPASDADTEGAEDDEDLGYDSDGNTILPVGSRRMVEEEEENDLGYGLGGVDDEKLKFVPKKGKGKKKGGEVDPMLELKRETARILRKSEPKLKEKPKTVHPLDKFFRSKGIRRKRRLPDGTLVEIPWSDEEQSAPSPTTSTANPADTVLPSSPSIKPDPSTTTAPSSPTKPHPTLLKPLPLKIDKIMTKQEYISHTAKKTAQRRARPTSFSDDDSDSSLELEIVQVESKPRLVDWNAKGGGFFAKGVTDKRRALKGELSRLEGVRKREEEERRREEGERRRREKGAWKWKRRVESGDEGDGGGREGGDEKGEKKDEDEVGSDGEGILRQLEEEGYFDLPKSPQSVVDDDGFDNGGKERGSDDEDDDDDGRDYPLAQRTPAVALQYSYSLEESQSQGAELYAGLDMSE
ncbi:hypothetical protein HDV00_000358, partial [Rhizophlyctis rosea]